MREFGDENLVVSAGKLFCEACREELSLRKSTIKNHIRSSKHSSMKDRLKERRARDGNLVQSLKKYDEEEHPSGEHLPESQRLYRIKFVKAFLRAGVALNKTDIFRDVFEEHGFRLACRRTLSDNIPFIHSQEISLMETEISAKEYCSCFQWN